MFVLPGDSPFQMFLATSTRSIEHHPTKQVYRLFINIGQLLFDGPTAILCQRWWWKPPKSSQIYRFGESTTCWPCPCGWNSQRWGLAWRVEGQACNMVDVCRHESCWISFLWQHFFETCWIHRSNLLEMSCSVLLWDFTTWFDKAGDFDLIYWFAMFPHSFEKAANQPAGFDNRFSAQQLRGCNSSDVESCTGAFIWGFQLQYCKMSLFEIYDDLWFMYIFKSPSELNGLPNVPFFFWARFIRSQEMGGLFRDNCSSYFSIFWASKACDFDGSLIIVTLSIKLMKLSH